jgi:hypothetical protein
MHTDDAYLGKVDGHGISRSSYKAAFERQIEQTNLPAHSTHPNSVDGGAFWNFINIDSYGVNAASLWHTNLKLGAKK